jgi:hypothetical protein
LVTESRKVVLPRMTKLAGSMMIGLTEPIRIVRVGSTKIVLAGSTRIVPAGSKMNALAWPKK